MGLIIDFMKAFDTIEWSFLLRILESFGFNDVFVGWIKSILQSAYLSFLINGKVVGFFQCSRGVRQGYPLSNFLFLLRKC